MKNPALLKWLTRGALGLLLLAAALAGLAWFELRRSLPDLDGTIRLPELAAEVTIERDAQGVPSILAEHRIDAARALGFVHGQDRFFQMDLARRFAAGELSELFGEGALAADKRQRMHRFRRRAEEVIESRSSWERRLGRAYCDGVNAGLASLGARPFEYFLLDAKPRSWTLVDSILVVYSMYLDLNDAYGEYEAARGAIEQVLGPEMLDFLDPLGNEWDAPVVGEPFEIPPIPGASTFDLRTRVPARDRRSGHETRGDSQRASAAIRGSNNWAVAGSLTADGRALLANDMHLGHQVPNIWYRARLEFPDETAPGGRRRLVGVTLPGVPFVIAGSNGEVAWGFTNTWGDWEDWVVLEPDPADPNWYLVPGGSKPFARFDELIKVKDGADAAIEVRETIWGPVLEEDPSGRARAYRWVAHDPEGVTFASLELEQASTVEEAVEIANRIGAPAQNFVAADSSGGIGWTVMGAIPRRFGHSGRTPRPWHDATRGWDGYYGPEEYPRLVNPGDGLIWTANSRVVNGEMLDKIGTGFRLGARAGQIRDRLKALEAADEAAMLAIQLDDRALFLERWRKLLLGVLGGAATPARLEIAARVESWGGHASVDSVGYRIVRAFRTTVRDRVYGSILEGCKDVDSRCRARYLNQLEGPLWRLVTERPVHFLSPEFASWDELFDAVVEELVMEIGGDSKGDVAGAIALATWGRRNTVAIEHPMSRSLPTFIARYLDMPKEPLPGDSNMPRVQGPRFGASERFVVSPGREQDGYFHMPTGQSGHPLSPFYRAGHHEWVRGEPTPFLPGEAKHRLALLPAAG